MAPCRFVLLGWDAWAGRLGANPVNFAIRTTGILSLIFLVLSLAVTPASRITGWGWLGQFRRMLGLYAFFHAALHFLLFFGLDRAANVGDTASEVLKRPYLMVGMVGLVLMVPLAATSTNGMIKRLGPARWKALHRLAYVAAAAGSLHFYMLVKADVSRPVAFAAALGLLFLYRLVAHYLQLRSDARKYRTRPRRPPLLRSRSPGPGKLRVAQVFDETPEVRTFRLASPDGPRLPFDFLPGQYLNLTLDDRRPEGPPVVHDRLAPDPGRVLRADGQARGPGPVVPPPARHRPRGRPARRARPGRPVHVHGGRGRRHRADRRGRGDHPADGQDPLPDRPELAGGHRPRVLRQDRAGHHLPRRARRPPRRHPNLHVTVTLTREDGAEWSGERGRINAAMLARVVPEIAARRVHICGPTEMTDPTRQMLRDLGVPDESIRDGVVRVAQPRPPSAEAGPASPPSGGSRSARRRSLRWRPRSRSPARRKSATAPGRQTVLEAAEALGVAINYDCRAGICGQCKIELLSGRVVMDAEDALDPVDRANDLILSCQAQVRRSGGGGGVTTVAAHVRPARLRLLPSQGLQDVLDLGAVPVRLAHLREDDLAFRVDHERRGIGGLA